MIDKLFYIIYNRYYDHGDGEYKGYSQLSVWALFMLAAMGASMTVYFIVELIIDPTSYAPQRHKTPLPDMWVFFSLGAAITYFSFVYRKRYKKIYEKYKDVAALDLTSTRVWGNVIILLIIISPIIFLILWKGLHEGVWVKFEWRHRYYH